MHNLEIELLLPQKDTPSPEVTILIPALNEELTIAQFIDWCLEGINKAGITGEILIVDSGDDKTSVIALTKGARVLKTPKRGLGRAYIDALPFVRGKYLILGDADCTYDFREIKPFIDEFKKGTEYIMGSRFKGFIEPGAMPALHRYFGTPLTTWMLNFMYNSSFSDIHCGMRGITKDAFIKLDLQSQGWEYASELVLKSVKMNFLISEVPIKFYKDREGRLSHHKRRGWISPWIAGWDNMKAMFLYGADVLLLKSGLWLFIISLVFTLILLIHGPVQFYIKSKLITLAVYWMFLGVAIATVGLQCIYLGILAQCMVDFQHKQLKYWTTKISYNKGALTGIGLVVCGILACLPLVYEYIASGLRLPGLVDPPNRLAILGILFMILGISTFSFTLLLYATALTANQRKKLAEMPGKL